MFRNNKINTLSCVTYIIILLYTSTTYTYANIYNHYGYTACNGLISNSATTNDRTHTQHDGFSS